MGAERWLCLESGQAIGRPGLREESLSTLKSAPRRLEVKQPISKESVRGPFTARLLTCSHAMHLRSILKREKGVSRLPFTLVVGALACQRRDSLLFTLQESFPGICAGASRYTSGVAGHKEIAWELEPGSRALAPVLKGSRICNPHGPNIQSYGFNKQEKGKNPITSGKGALHTPSLATCATRLDKGTHFTTRDGRLVKKRMEEVML